MKLFHSVLTYIFAMTLTGVFLAGAVSAADPVPENPNAAMVNGTAITKADIDVEMQKVRQYLTNRGQQVSDEQLNQLQDRILDDLISRELLYQASRKKGISVDPETARNEIEGMKKKFEKEEDFVAALESLQMSEDQMAASIQRDMTIHRFVKEEILVGVAVTDPEKREFYDSHPEFFKTPEKVRASHILIQLDEKAGDDEKAAALKKIEEVAEKLKNGEDFAETAKAYSEGPSAAKGGDLGDFARGQMVKPFEDAVFGLDVGATSEIVQTRFGYHIILCTDRQPAGTASYEAEAEKIGQHLQKAKSDKAVVDYIEGLKGTATIEKLP